ncbi:ComEC/Rec2-related protein [Pararhizobium capsulatum DSM 1112]|uniref:ComEC/Rec2-related protein n=1 Tax=Pararhizobium capsulatum DSM 1112 TaxID=1121113 RepID=A0ABU0BPK0_9HYPH|nr:ComEC/Rec2 family competence protein [Pararhizobium capsulatum]MDQ0320179.1 ComEC/Rec2-related protein [Pararhizobium capsulatum DSM 1112]
MIKVAVLLCIFGMAALWLRHSATVWRLVFLHGFLFLAGMLLAAWQTARMDTVILDTPVTTTVSGVVAGRETTDRGYWRYTVDVTKTADPELMRPPERVTLLSRQQEAPIAIGGALTGKARLSPPSGPALPGLNDFAFDSYFNGIGAVGYFYGKPVSVEGTERSSSALTEASEFVAQLRASIGTRIRAALPGDVGALAAALVTGEERAIDRKTVKDLRQAGLAHVLAISGLNMVLAAGTLLVGVRLALSVLPGVAHRFPIKKLAAAGALSMVCFYILISGGAVSAMRSWIMISLMLVAVFFDRPAISLRNVALSAILILVITPSAVTGPGFQMSYAATLGLIAGYRFWRERPQENVSFSAAPLIVLRAAFFFLSGLLISSLIGGFSTMIYSAGHFHRLAAYGLVGNMLAMPIISVLVMPFALVAMVVMPFGLEKLPLWVMGQGLEWMILISRMVSSWGGEATTGRLAPAGFLLIAVGGVVLCLLRTRLAFFGALLVVAGLAAILFNLPVQPDVVISEDGRLVALLDGKDVSLNRSRPPDFIFSQWQRALRLSDPVPPAMRPELALLLPDERALNAESGGGRKSQRQPIDAAAATKAAIKLLSAGSPGRFACVARQWCAATTRQNWRIIVVEDARLSGAACDAGDLVIVSSMVRLERCRSGARLVTARSLRRAGALELYASPGGDAASIRLVTAILPEELSRPWARHRTYDWRSDQFEAADSP